MLAPKTSQAQNLSPDLGGRGGVGLLSEEGTQP